MYQSQMPGNKEGKVGKSEGGEAESSWDVERLDAASEKSVLIVLAMICSWQKKFGNCAIFRAFCWCSQYGQLIELKYTPIRDFLDAIHRNGCNMAQNLQFPQVGGVAEW